MNFICRPPNNTNNDDTSPSPPGSSHQQQQQQHRRASQQQSGGGRNNTATTTTCSSTRRTSLQAQQSNFITTSTQQTNLPSCWYSAALYSNTINDVLGDSACGVLRMAMAPEEKPDEEGGVGMDNMSLIIARLSTTG